MSKYEYILNPGEIALLNGIVELLDVFNIFTVFIQGCEYPTMNTIVLFYTEIEDRLNKIEQFNTIETIEKAAKILREKLPERIQLLNEYIAAALIDPHLQHLEIVDRWISDRGMWSLQYSIKVYLLVSKFLLI